MHLGRSLAVGAATALAVALWDAHFLVVATAAGPWRGLVDPPGPPRLAAALALGAFVAWLAHRRPSRAWGPLAALGLAAAPLVPVVTGLGTVLLAFQGGTLVLVAAAAAAVALVRLLDERRARPPVVPTWALALVAFVAYAALGTRVPGAARAQGDEPQYLLMAHSLVHDRDLDLANQFAERQYAPFYGGDLDAHASAASPPGSIYSTHAPGLPALVAPAYALGGYRGVVVFLSMLVAVAMALLRDVVAEHTDGWTALAAWAVAALTPLVPVFALAIYPETVALAALALLLRLGRGAPGPTAAVAGGLVAGAMVWLHPKFIVLGAAALLPLLLRLRGSRDRVLAAAAFALAATPFVLFLDATYGSPSLSAGFGRPALSLRALPRGAAGLVFDRQRGLLAVAPVWALAAFGAAAAWRARRLDTTLLVAIAAVPIAIGGAFQDWGGGASPPARYLVPALVPLTPLLAEGLRRRRDLGAALAGVGFGILLVAAGNPRVLRTSTPAQSHLLRDLSPVDLNALAPTFLGPDQRAPLLLSATAIAALALAWRFRGRGALAGALAYLLVATAARTQPLLDDAAAARLALATWDRGNALGPTGALDVSGLAVPLELVGGPQAVAAGAVRRSPRIDVPPGSYRLAVETSAAAGTGPATMRLLVGAGPLTFAEAEVTAGAATTLPLDLPTGARGLGFVVEAGAEPFFFARALLRPEVVVPRSRRAPLGWSGRLRPEQHRLSRGGVRVTVLEGLEPEGDGFRLTGEEARLAIDGPLGRAFRLEVRRDAPRGGDTVVCGERRLPMGPEKDAVWTVSTSDGEPLGRVAVVGVAVRARGALLRVESP
jgi:hypothetical protein